MKRIIPIICAIFLTFSLTVYADFDEKISAESAVLYSADTGEVIFEHNADKKMLIASITKIMTAIVIIENCDLDEEICPKPEWCAVEGSSMYLDYTKTYTVREVLTGMLLVSGNDAATALACHMCGDERSFSAKMNETAKRLGMKNSSFRNPHGLDDDEHYSTARDMARLAAYCMENDEFRTVVSRYSATVDINTYYNHNKLLLDYPGCIGVKTGYTMAAGRTLVSCAERNGMRLICVTLNASDDWNDHKKLLDYGFDNYSVSYFGSENISIVLPVISGVKGTSAAAPQNEIRLMTKNSDRVDVKLELPGIIFAGVFRGEKVGEIEIFVNGELAARENLIYTETVAINENERLSGPERFMRFADLSSKPFYVRDSNERKNSENYSLGGYSLTQSRRGDDIMRQSHG